MSWAPSTRTACGSSTSRSTARPMPPSTPRTTRRSTHDSRRCWRESRQTSGTRTCRLDRAALAARRARARARQLAARGAVPAGRAGSRPRLGESDLSASPQCRLLDPPRRGRNSGSRRSARPPRLGSTGDERRSDESSRSVERSSAEGPRRRVRPLIILTMDLARTLHTLLETPLRRRRGGPRRPLSPPSRSVTTLGINPTPAREAWDRDGCGDGAAADRLAAFGPRRPRPGHDPACDTRAPVRRVHGQRSLQAGDRQGSRRPPERDHDRRTFTSVGVRPNIARSAATAAGSGGARPYRLVFDAEDNLPVITIYAEAPDANRARSLADASVFALARLRREPADR